MSTSGGTESHLKDIKRCGFYVQRKRRHCRMIPAKGNMYCAEHLCFQDESFAVTRDAGNGNEGYGNDISSKKRVPCPLDPKHSVFEDRLQKHLKKCNSRHKKQQEYYEEKVNSGLDYESGQIEKVPLNEISKDEVIQLIQKVNSFHSKSKLIVCENFHTHSVLKEELANEEYGEKTRKHLLQQASLINILEQNNTFREDITFIEMGAGKGKFSHWLQKAVGDVNNVEYFLIDRQNHRNKFDCYHKGEDQGPSFKRLFVDIEHLNLAKVADLKGKEIVGIGKHLCGGATDLALRCLLESSTKENIELPHKKPKTEGKETKVQLVLIALCCYHRCTWPSFVGREFFVENGFNEVDFHRMTQLCSWAVCGHRHSEKVKTSANKDEFPITYQPESCNTPLSPEEKKEIGLKCKRIIDLGRCSYLKKHGFQAELLHYVNSNITLENVALLAKPQHA